MKQTQQLFSTISYNQLTKMWKFENLSHAHNSDNFYFCELVLQIVGNEAKMLIDPWSSESEIMEARIRELISVEATGDTVNTFSNQELSQYLKLKMGKEAVSWVETQWTSAWNQYHQCYHS